MGADAVLAPYGGQAPLRAQEADAATAEGSGTQVGIRLVDLVDRITYTIVDRFEVKLTNLTASETYQLIVSSDSATTLGIDGCGAASQKRTVTGATSQNLYFIVYACAVGEGTVTAEVRRTGARHAEATVSQRLTVLPIPDYVPADERPARGASGAVAWVGTPGIVMNLQHGRWATSFEVTWDKPADGGRALTSYGVLQWTGPDQPDWDEAESIDPSPRRKTYTGLQLDTVYKFRIHACSGDHSCGWWTDIHEVRTGRRPDPPHTISFPEDYLTATSVKVTWSAASDTGGVPLTGFQVQYWPRSSPSDARTVTVKDKNARRHTITGLTAGTEYVVKLRACNDPNSCSASAWSADHHVTTTAVELISVTPTTTPTPVAIDPECPATSADTVPLSQLRVDVVPQAQRQATICWAHVQNATAYVIRATDKVGNVHTTAAGDWHPVPSITEIPIEPGKPQRQPLNLDKILDEDGNDRGLAHKRAYGIRIGVKYATGTILYTTPVIIIDTPITKADGSDARAEVTWDLVGAADRAE